MQFLFLLQIGVVLSQTLQSQLVSETNVLGLAHVLLLERLDLNWVGSGEKHNLGIVHHHNNALYNLREIIGEQLINLIENKHFALVELSDIL